ncbi:MAG: signal peptide peptidase SppA [Desulfocapsa sp.]|nr:signal peptide peptidase SppA [Desulfocapsa sp.]MBN4059997.1 signal peptide peptidase SppA [Desulfotalea psychrophila]
MKNLLTSIFNIFRWMGRFLTGVRNLTLNTLFLVLIFFLFTSLYSYSPETTPKASGSGALVLSLSGDIVEEKQTSDLLTTAINDKLGFNTLPTETLFQDILDAIDVAATDDNVSSILLDLSKLGSVGINQLQTIGAALTDFKTSGKKVIAAEDFYKQKAYYLATFADEIYLNPMGGVDLHGIGSYRLYFKDAIDKLRINYNIFRVGTFKSALEPIMRNSMSVAARAQSLSWLTPLWETITTDIIRERELSPDRINNYTENIASELATAGGDTARLALESGLVDGLKNRQELQKLLVKVNGQNEKGTFKRIALNDYLKTISRSFVNPPDGNGSIGIIVAQGAIMNGKQPIGRIGGDSLALLIRKARLDSNVNAIVLRIVSGGGSAFASEVIRQEILEYKKTGKPIVISMGSMAASGGYWIAADADEIWASPVTLTGSIGIFAAIPTFENSLSELGIYNDGVGTTSIAAALDLSRPLSPILKEAMEISLQHYYGQFLGIVANGRSISPQRIKEIADGKVYDGKSALDIGLVDKLGTLEDAIASAAALSGLAEYTASYINHPLTVKEEFLKMFSGKVVHLLASWNFPSTALTAISRLIAPIREIMLFNDPKGIYAHCLIHDFSL